MVWLRPIRLLLVVLLGLIVAAAPALARPHLACIPGARCAPPDPAPTARHACCIGGTSASYVKPDCCIVTAVPPIDVRLESAAAVVPDLHVHPLPAELDEPTPLAAARPPERPLHIPSAVLEPDQGFGARPPPVN